MLEAVKLCKAFDGKPVIRDFSMVFAPGGHYCLMGPSGCGKTTLLTMLMGLLPPDSGQLLGHPKRSAVFQENRLLEHMTAYGNIALVCSADRPTTEALLLRLGLEQAMLSQPVGHFSGGMKRRVALARALLADYDMLFLDEPYKGLDEATGQQVQQVVQAETAGKTLLLLTHDPQEAAGYQLIAAEKAMVGTSEPRKENGF